MAFPHGTQRNTRDTLQVPNASQTFLPTNKHEIPTQNPYYPIANSHMRIPPTHPSNQAQQTQHPAHFSQTIRLSQTNPLSQTNSYNNLSLPNLEPTSTTTVSFAAQPAPAQAQPPQTRPPPTSNREAGAPPLTTRPHGNLSLILLPQTPPLLPNPATVAEPTNTQVNQNQALSL